MKNPCFIIIVSISIISCSIKDKTTPKINTDNILIGDTTNMILYHYDTLINGGYYTPKSFDIDINHDQIYDFRFESVIWGSPAQGHYPQLWISSLNNNSFLKGNLNDDTTFLNILTSISNLPDTTFRVVKYNEFSCYKQGHQDLIEKIMFSQFTLELKKDKDVLNKTDFFHSDTALLFGHKSQQVNSPIQSNDTIFIDSFTWDYDCFNITIGNSMFIGIKIIKNGNQKLGWIKFKIIDLYNILIEDCAFQK